MLLDLIGQRQHLGLLFQQRFVFILQISFNLAQSFLQLLDLGLRRGLGFLLVRILLGHGGKGIFETTR